MQLTEFLFTSKQSIGDNTIWVTCLAPHKSHPQHAAIQDVAPQAKFEKILFAYIRSFCPLFWLTAKERGRNPLPRLR